MTTNMIINITFKKSFKHDHHNAQPQKMTTEYSTTDANNHQKHPKKKKKNVMSHKFPCGLTAQPIYISPCSHNSETFD